MPGDYVSMPTKGNEESDHGCFAVIGDMVECLNPMGERLGIYGVVQSEEHRPSIRGPKRILNVYMNWNDGPSLEPYQDAFLRIVSRVSNVSE